jgi:predicted RNA binding protein YcfA (HicA-like mRNA interferase family)
MKYREILRQLRRDGWVVVTVRGSHRQLKHPTKPGKVTVAGHPSRDIPPTMLKSIRRQAGWEV